MPLYQSEIAPPRIRGLLVGMHGIMICVGYCLASWVGLGFYFVNASGAQWRMPLAIQCLYPLILASGIMFLPESPRWLLDQDNAEEALRSFESVRAESDDSILNDRQAILHEFETLKALIKEEKFVGHHFKDLFKTPSMRKRCLMGFVILFGCQGTGTLVINSKSTFASPFCLGPSGISRCDHGAERSGVLVPVETDPSQTMVLCFISP